MAERAEIREVGLRDGLQMAGTVLSTERKLRWARAEAEAGLREIEVTSFVPPSVIPQFADAAAVAREAVAIPGLLASALVPNLKGALRGFELGVAKLNVVVSASAEHNLANVRRTTEESLEDFRRIVAERDARGLKGRVAIAGGVATALGCTIAGDVPQSRVLEVARSLLEAGADELMLADTVGYGHPEAVRRLFSAALSIAGSVPVAAHFHDTRGLGLANVLAALEAGVRRFDASLAGLGGCPFAPGATGNINTEDCAFLLAAEGFETGIDIERLIALRAEVETWLPGERFGGMVFRAGLPKTFRRAA